MVQLSSWHANQLVFVDKSAANLHTADRKFGWAAVKKQAVTKESFQKGKHYSILSAYTIDGYIAWEVYEGGVNKEMFNTFIREKVLPLCGQFPEPRSVLCMDNCGIHRSEVSLHTNISILAIAIANLSDRSLQPCAMRPASSLHFSLPIRQTTTLSRSRLVG